MDKSDSPMSQSQQMLRRQFRCLHIVIIHRNDFGVKTAPDDDEGQPTLEQREAGVIVLRVKEQNAIHRPLLCGSLKERQLLLPVLKA